jgi:hypothetical protein
LAGVQEGDDHLGAPREPALEERAALVHLGRVLERAEEEARLLHQAVAPLETAGPDRDLGIVLAEELAPVGRGKRVEDLDGERLGELLEEVAELHDGSGFYPETRTPGHGGRASGEPTRPGASRR